MSENAGMHPHTLETRPDQIVHDLLNHRLQFFKNGVCLLDCSVEEFLSNPTCWPLLSDSARQYLEGWKVMEAQKS